MSVVLRNLIVVVVGLANLGLLASEANAQWFRCQPCPCPPSDPAYGMGQVDPSDPPSAPQPPYASPSDSLDPTMPAANTFASASQFASTSESVGFRDATIGDFFGSAAQISGPTWGISNPEAGFYAPNGAGDRRFKLSDHTSPLPTDRLFFNYNHFSRPVIDAHGNRVDVNRFTFGLEKTFLDDSTSLELRVPFAGGLDSSPTQVNYPNPEVLDGVEFGNIALTLKAILLEYNRITVSGGLGMITPTAADSSISKLNDDEAIQLLEIKNETLYLQPFISFYTQPTDRTWVLFYTQADFATNGNRVISSNFQGSRLSESRFNDQHLLFMDLSMGHWFYKDPTGSQFIRGMASILELHYTTTLNDTDGVQAGPSEGDRMTNPFNRLDALNLTAGLRFQLGERYMLTAAGVAPLRGGSDRLFDSEFALLLSRFY
ncbi:MAG: hypothetical protein WD045_17045 [Pirellulaceae bacterium]